jgi:hypothetical protein
MSPSSPVVVWPSPGVVLARCVIAVLLVVVLGHLLYIWLGLNFHTVLPWKVYRSAQPSGAALERFVRHYQIRTIINLRGCCPTGEWYLREAETTAKLGINQEDINMSASRLPSTNAIRRLVEVLDRSEYPLLFHCHQGADRTGLASVVIALLQTQETLSQALTKLGPATGHLPLGKTRNVDRFFEFYAEWLREQDKAHSPQLFREWAIHHYCPGTGLADLGIVEANADDEEPTIGTKLTLAAQQGRTVTLRCANRSDAIWKFDASGAIGTHVQGAIWDHDERVVAVVRLGSFAAQVAPGQQIELPCPLPALASGDYELRLDLWDGQHASFVQLGNELLVVRLEVR